MKKGFVTLLSVLIVSALALVVATSLLLVGTSSTKSSISFITSNQAKGLANGCAEAALTQIQANINFSGTNNLTYGNGTCSYTVTKLTGQNRTIAVTASAGQSTRKINININQISPNIITNSWQEVP